MILKEFVKTHSGILKSFVIIGTVVGLYCCIGFCVASRIDRYNNERLQKVTRFLSDNHYTLKTIEFAMERPEFGSGCIRMHQAFLASAIKNDNRFEIKGCCTDDFNSCHVIKEVIIK